jgi:NADH:ubiquinone oxidoreductase subunit 3 (subunit A)
MSNLDEIINYTTLFQDVELSTALQQLRGNPGQLQQFLQSQQDNLYKDVIAQKQTTFDKAYGDLQRASVSQESAIMFNKSSSELSNVQQQMFQNKKKNADAVLYDKNIANRKYEMNEWSIGNKRDTLFVYSMLFIVLSSIALFILLWRLGIIGITLCISLIAPLLLIFVFTIVERSQYTDVLRNKRYWNRRKFKGEYGKIPIPNICPGSINRVEKDIQSAENTINVDINQDTQRIQNTTANIFGDISKSIKGN